MATVLAEPRRPIADWQIRLTEWVAETNEIVQQASDWAKANAWDTLTDQKVITEDPIGKYEVPRLLIHRTDGKLLLDPIARYVVGAAGRFELCVIPSYDSVVLVKTDTGWRFYSTTREGFDLPWSADTFTKVCNELVHQQ
jgi:hypothetical protein